MNVPEVDVVILTWNDAEDAQMAVASAIASEDVNAHVFVIDNASEQPFAYQGLADVHVCRLHQNLGVGGGRNRGAALGSAPLICFLDSDAELRPSALSVMAEVMLADDRVGLVAPVFEGQEPNVGAGRAPSIARKLVRGAGLTDRYRRTRRMGHDATWEIEFAIGACQLVRREAFGAVGGLDQSALFGPEDLEFCTRLRSYGWRLLQARDAVCAHVARRAARRLFTRRGARHAVAVARYYLNSRAGPPFRSR